MIHVMIIYDVVNIFSMKNYKSSRKLRVGLNWYLGVNWSTTTIVSLTNFGLAENNLSKDIGETFQTFKHTKWENKCLQEHYDINLKHIFTNMSCQIYVFK